jgi:CRISPR-associated protein Csx3
MPFRRRRAQDEWQEAEVSTFSIRYYRAQVSQTDAILLRLSFGDPATNDVIVRGVEATMRKLKDDGLSGGKIVLLNGASSLAVMAVITHHLAHLFGTVAIYDPKLEAYIVVVNHGPAFNVGDTIPANAVTEVSNGQ